ncbi:MAG: hypothetical protein WBI04_00290 [Trichlorobacter sp.]|jgi:hypothetical protein
MKNAHKKHNGLASGLPDAPRETLDSAAPQTISTDEIVFLFIGGAHQVFHLAPVAAELSRLLPRQPVTCLTADAATTVALQHVYDVLSPPNLRIESVNMPIWGRMLSQITGRKSSLKRPLLLSLRQRLRRAAAIVTPERTSAVLRKMGLKNTLMIHFRHGAGDRAPKSEKRLAAFDLVVVPGEKDFHRAVEKGFPAEKLRVCGYVKLDFCGHSTRSLPHFFDNGKPTILYNPHFDIQSSSLLVAEQVIRQIMEQSPYNLVVAPHIRTAENMSELQRTRWQQLIVPGRMIIDLDSPRLIDMTYTLSADLYLGDVSSQLYEFLIRPRPVAFINAHHVAWQSNKRFAGWALGEVAEEISDVVTAIDRAIARHPSMIGEQQAAVIDAFGEVSGAVHRGALIIATAVDNVKLIHGD